MDLGKIKIGHFGHKILNKNTGFLSKIFESFWRSEDLKIGHFGQNMDQI
jgi:hypothetical protein